MSDFREFASTIARRLAQLEAESENLRLRLDNILREGRVTKIDEETGKAEVDMHGLPSDALDISHRSGAIREWNPPAVGERVFVLNPSGEPGRGIVMPGGYSAEFTQPHKKAGESYKAVGETSVLQTPETVVYRAGGATITVHKSGKVTLDGVEITMKAPVVMEKGFRAKPGTGTNTAGVVEGELHTTGDVTSQTKVAAPILQGSLQNA